MSHTQDDELDLAWYFNEATGDISMPSSFGAMVARLQLGKQTKVYATSASAENQIEHRLDACRRYEAVESALETLSAARQTLLEEAYEHCRCPVELVSKPRHLFKAARGAPAMHAFLKEIGCRTWTAKQAEAWLARSEHPLAHSGHEVSRLEALSESCWAEAADVVSKALDAYGDARRETKRQADRERAARFARVMSGGRL